MISSVCMAWRNGLDYLPTSVDKIDPFFIISGGGGEIRTLGGLSPSLVFKTSAFNRSANPPEAVHLTQLFAQIKQALCAWKYC